MAVGDLCSMLRSEHRYKHYLLTMACAKTRRSAETQTLNLQRVWSLATVGGCAKIADCS